MVKIGNATWTSGPIASAKTIVPMPTLPPSSQPMASTCFDCGAHQPDRVAAGSESGHQSVAGSRAETGTDVHPGGDGVQHDRSNKECPPGDGRFGVAEHADRGFEHKPDHDSVQHGAGPCALSQWDPQRKDQQAHDDDNGTERRPKRRCQTLVKHVPRV